VVCFGVVPLADETILHRTRCIVNMGCFTTMLQKEREKLCNMYTVHGACFRFYLYEANLLLVGLPVWSAVLSGSLIGIILLCCIFGQIIGLYGLSCPKIRRYDMIQNAGGCYGIVYKTALLYKVSHSISHTEMKAKSGVYLCR